MDENSRESSSQERAGMPESVYEQPFLLEFNPTSGLILLVSRDEVLEKTRALVMQQGGYHTVSTGNMTCALELAARCEMCIIEHTFSPDEQDEFIDRVHASYPNVCQVCLRFPMTHPHELLKIVRNCSVGQPGRL